MDRPTAIALSRPLGRGAVALALGLLVALAPVQAGVYKWTDAEGRLHFSDKAPSRGDVEQVQIQPANGYRGSERTAPVPAADHAANREAKARSVMMFSAAWCPYCAEARRYFQANRVAFRERDLDKEPAARREYERLGGNGLPLILVGDQRLSGFSVDAFRRLYDR